MNIRRVEFQMKVKVRFLYSTAYT